MLVGSLGGKEAAKVVEKICCSNAQLKGIHQVVQIEVKRS
jgi:hypothetical protein